MKTIPLVKPAEIEARVKEAGLSMAAFLRAANWNSTSWYNWRKGKMSPTLEKYIAAVELLGITE